MYNYGYGYPTVASASSNDATAIAVIVGFIIAIIGSVLIFVLFLKKDNEKKFNGFTKWLYDFLQFNKLCIDDILKFTYLFLAIFITIVSFGLISSSFVSFLVFLIVGNLITRIIYELIMVQILIHRNIREINEKTKK